MVDSTDHVTAETGLSPTVTISKNGGAYGAASGAVTEVGNGVYSYAGNATDRETLGELMIHAEAAGADKVDMKVLITSYDPFVDIASILADTGTDGVIVASGTVTTLTNLPAVTTDWLTAAGIKADAVTKIQANLALEATLTAIKGAGWTTETLAALDALIDAIKAKTDQLVFTTPNKVDATATVDPTGIATSAALAVVDANVDAIKLKTDALDVSSVSFVTSVVGSTITILRGDTWDDAHLLNLGDLTQYVSIDFMIKRSASELDADAIIHIRKNASGLTDGLLRLNGAAHTTGTDGSITIDDAPTGDVTIMLKANITDDLTPGTYVYDIQLIEASEVSTLTTGTLVVTGDVTRLVA